MYPMKERKMIRTYCRTIGLCRECAHNIITAKWLNCVPVALTGKTTVPAYIESQIEEIKQYANMQKTISNHFLAHYGLKHRFKLLPVQTH